MFKIKKQESGYGWWLFRKKGKGTAAEEWPTAEELWNDPNIKKEIKEVQQIFKIATKNNNQNK